MMEHQNIHHMIKITLQGCPIFTRCFVCLLNALQLPVRPVEEVLVLGQGHRARQVVLGYYCSVATCRCIGRHYGT